MLKSIIIIFAIFINFIIAQQNIIDDRYGNRIPQPSSYFGVGYGMNVPNNNINMNNNNNNNNNNNINNNNKDGPIEEFGQCGGLDWEGPKTCQANLICLKRSKYYSQCLSSEEASKATRPSPQVIPPGGKCHGGNIHGPIACAIGTACFIQTENVHGECKAHCPQGWFCAKQTLPEWAPCGGEGYIGLTKCKEGLQCYAHSRWYHECRSECPAGWKC
ncbi:unnamed protein product [Rotaria sordida]|uniref:CBM1 domain-containing protein n=1 Tax=Rotaria sordida TaxID=392033 RepID=A0A818WVF6_9BILA|nr:unnamed protein product [Rotaria sordida]CAF0797709.1 unnamed protein product [Rotaria sordida]CAF0853539.1 unnamed protein product [Rotaria sordida]CAF3653612.1 unnamed protein product [Rotaria sordida]CAF3692151.1 unnamed protein product [Rotaria sordida]